MRKSYYGEPIGTHQRSFQEYHPDPLRHLLPQDWGFATPTQNFNRYYLRNGRRALATDFKFGRYIQRVHPNKSPLKFGRKGSVGVFSDCPVLKVSPIISGTDKATDFTFGRYIHTVHPNKSPLKIWEKWERGCRDCPMSYYPRNGQSYGLQIRLLNSQGPSEQKPVKNFGENGAWAYSCIYGLPKVLK